MKNAKNACVLQVFFTLFGPLLGKTLKKCQKSTKKVPPKPAKTSILPFGAVHGFSRLVPDFQKVVLEFAESGVKFWPEICRILGFGGFGAGGG